jgi:hypothetical protein
MKKFKILVHGENLNVYLDGELVRAGFYVTRVVYDNTAQQAEKTVLDELVNLPKLREHMVHDPNDPPTFNVEAIEEIEGAHPLEENPSGLVFYKMELH